MIHDYFASTEEVIAMHYDHEREVQATLRNLSDDDLIRIHQQGIDERANGGPADLDVARSDFLLNLFATERAIRAIQRAFPGAIFIESEEAA